MVAWVMNDEFKRMWKEVVAVCFKVLSWHSPRGTEVTHENPQSGSPVSSWRSAAGTCLTQLVRPFSIKNGKATPVTGREGP
jgi:hypothetical protein